MSPLHLVRYPAREQLRWQQDQLYLAFRKRGLAGDHPAPVKHISREARGSSQVYPWIPHTNTPEHSVANAKGGRATIGSMPCLLSQTIGRTGLSKGLYPAHRRGSRPEAANPARIQPRRSADICHACSLREVNDIEKYNFLVERTTTWRSSAGRTPPWGRTSSTCYTSRPDESQSQVRHQHPCLRCSSFSPTLLQVRTRRLLESSPHCTSHMANPRAIVVQFGGVLYQDQHIPWGSCCCCLCIIGF